MAYRELFCLNSSDTRCNIAHNTLHNCIGEDGSTVQWTSFSFHTIIVWRTFTSEYWRTWLLKLKTAILTRIWVHLRRDWSQSASKESLGPSSMDARVPLRNLSTAVCNVTPCAPYSSDADWLPSPHSPWALLASWSSSYQRSEVYHCVLGRTTCDFWQRTKSQFRGRPSGGFLDIKLYLNKSLVHHDNQNIWISWWKTTTWCFGSKKKEIKWTSIIESSHRFKMTKVCETYTI